MTDNQSKDYNWDLLILLVIIAAGLIFVEELIFVAIGAGVIPNV